MIWLDLSSVIQLKSSLGATQEVRQWEYESKHTLQVWYNTSTPDEHRISHVFQVIYKK